MDKIGEKTGISDDLRTFFPNNYNMIETIAYYLIFENNNPLFRFGRWSLCTGIRMELTSLLNEAASCSPESRRSKQKFFHLQGRRRSQDEFRAYDSTSISSRLECPRQVRYGKNKDDERLPQINLLLLFSEKSNLPFYYRKLAGNIPDVKTVRILLRDLEVLGYRKVKLVTDRGFNQITANKHFCNFCFG